MKLFNLFKRKAKRRSCETCCFAEIQTECNFQTEERLIYFYDLYKCTQTWDNDFPFNNAVYSAKDGKCPRYKRKK